MFQHNIIYHSFWLESKDLQKRNVNFTYKPHKMLLQLFSPVIHLAL